MADGRTKRLADVVVGDKVYGTVRGGGHRRFVKTEVLAHWSTTKAAYRVELEDGTKLIVSGDHRLLSNRGWKHVTGTEQGAGRRSHLTRNNKLMGTGHFAEPPKFGDDYKRGYLCGLIRADGHIGTYEYARFGRSPRRFHRFRLALIDVDALERARDYLAENGIETRWFTLHDASGTRKTVHAIRAQNRAAVLTILDILEWPVEPSHEWCKGFLAGLFDAEGSHNRAILRISNTDPEILQWTRSALQLLGFDVATEISNLPNNLTCLRIRGGVQEHLRFFHTVDPAILRKRTIEGQAIKNDAPLRVCSIEPLGLDLPMFDITTGTGDFIANGVVSHNCFARPTHEYLNLDPATDFDRVIIVKVNAVERLRAELAPRRWQGDHIAMGTNTDPYQRAEGKYRLTQGIIDVLGEAGNPFSILTKGTLVLRDLDRLVEARRRTDVELCFSIGTLDDDVWRATEPGTPHPRKRVEAVAKLNDAGIPCGVLVAPILPGLSDTREKLDEVVGACVDAGARSISPVLLHLRPGVKEHYLGWLSEHRPDLLEQHARLYPGSYAPKRERERVTQLVRDLVAKHRAARGAGPLPHLSSRFDPA